MAPGSAADNLRPDLFVPLMLPGCILGLRAVLDVQILAGWLPFLPAAVIAVVMAIVIRRVQSERQIALWLYLLIYIPVMGFYGYGTTVLANKLLDQAPPKMYLTFVYDRSVSKISRHIDRDLRLGLGDRERRRRMSRCRAASSTRSGSTTASASCSIPAPSALPGSRSSPAAERARQLAVASARAGRA